MLDELVASALDKVQLSAFDLRSFSTLDTTCQHLEVLASLFTNSEANVRLAFFCRCLLKALWVDLERPEEERIIASRPDLRLHMIRVLEHLLQTMKPIYEQCSREELRQLERALDARFKKHGAFKCPNAWAILPNECRKEPSAIHWMEFPSRERSSRTNDTRRVDSLLRAGRWNKDPGHRTLHPGRRSEV